MVVITIYTVGYDEAWRIDTLTLRAVTITLIVAGCTGMIFVTGAPVRLITTRQFQQIMGTRCMTKWIAQLRRSPSDPLSMGLVSDCGGGSPLAASLWFAWKFNTKRTKDTKRKKINLFSIS